MPPSSPMPLRPAPHASAARATTEDAASLRAAIQALLAYRGIPIAPPGPRDLVVLLRGMPVAPWVPLRAASDVWATWLRQLERLWVAWDVADAPPPGATRWDAWRSEHIVSLEARRAGIGARLLAQLLEAQSSAREAVHLVGHSVGGAAILAYLADIRAGAVPFPPVRLRTAITLDAAVTGVAGVWSGARRSLFETASKRLGGLGAWANQCGVALLTATNERDMWSHRALGDLLYLGLRHGPPRGLLQQIDGTIHGWLRRTPHLAEALWGAGMPSYLPAPRMTPATLAGEGAPARASEW